MLHADGLGGTYFPAHMDPAQLSSTLANPSTAAVASITKIAEDTPLDALRKSYGLYAGHSYSVAGVTADGKIALSNPWGYNHPMPVPIDDFQRLFNHIDVWP
ncbi:MAG: hypothetical protein FWH11_13530 [Micrococcales bacterium]|nr:hypothetical protein [Micrococcales bacterium]